MPSRDVGRVWISRDAYRSPSPLHEGWMPTGLVAQKHPLVSQHCALYGGQFMFWTQRGGAVYSTWVRTSAAIPVGWALTPENPLPWNVNSAAPVRATIDTMKNMSP